MSRVGKSPIPVPTGVTVEWSGLDVSVKGPKGALSMRMPDKRISIEREGQRLRVKRHSEDKRVRSYHGLVNRLVCNMIAGVTQGFKKEIELQGVGFRAQAQAGGVTLNLGFSHPINYVAPKGIKIETPNQTSIVVSGIDKQAVGQVAAEIRAFRPPDPYKGKGARYVGEYVRILEGKKAAKA